MKNKFIKRGSLAAVSGPADPSAARRRCTAILLLALLLASPASAVYAMDGVALHTAVHGKHHGTVSVSGGHGLAPSPYSQSFTVPAGTVRYARLYVGVWGGTPEYTGTLETSLNGASLGSRTMGGSADRNSQVYVSGYGVHWSAYDVTARVRAGANSAIATTAGDIDGRIYGMLLAVATEDSSAPEIEYWFAEGNENLNAAGKKDAAALSLGGGPLPSSVTAGRLHVAYLASTRGDGDRLLFNGKEIATDAAGASSGAYFDARSYDVSALSRDTATVGFGRGNANRLHPVFVAYVATLVGAQAPSPTTVPATAPPAPISLSPTTTVPAAPAAGAAATTTTGAAPVPAATTATTAATATTLSATVTAVTTASPATTPPTATNAATTTVATTATTAPTLTDAPTDAPVAATVSAATPAATPDGTPVPPAWGGTTPGPTEALNASAVTDADSGRVAVSAVAGDGSIGALIAADPPGFAGTAVLVALLIGAGILVFSLIAGAGLFAYHRLAGERAEVPGLRSRDDSGVGAHGAAAGTPATWRRADDE